MDRRQGGRTGSVHGYTRPVEIEHVGDAIGNGIKTRPSGVVAVHDADEDPDLADGWKCRISARTKICGCVTGVLDAGVGLLQEESLLGIQHLGFWRGDMEEEGIELVDVTQESTPFTIALARFPLVCVEEFSPIPAIVRDLLDAVASRLQIVPKLMHVSRQGVAARKTDDGNVDHTVAGRRWHGCGFVIR